LSSTSRFKLKRGYSRFRSLKVQQQCIRFKKLFCKILKEIRRWITVFTSLALLPKPYTINFVQNIAFHAKMQLQKMRLETIVANQREKR
jgi:hypothetical protein